MAQIRVETAGDAGRLKPLNGICNGPVSLGRTYDCSKYYREAGFSFCRLHDSNYPVPREVDIPAIFRDFGADENDPASYDFRFTDLYISEIMQTGAQIIWRLGTSIEGQEIIKTHIYPPPDFEKWARVCIQVIRHYNDGWADGFHYGIRYWEIWNEPDTDRTHETPEDIRGEGMWIGTRAQYFALYETAAKAIKAYDPGLQVGGYAATALWSNPDYMPEFLRMCKKTGAPLDFFSWHCYADDPQITCRWAALVARQLDEAGFSDVPTILDEWNFLSTDPDIWTDLSGPRREATRKATFERGYGHEGAAYAAANMIALNDCRVDIATVYDGQPYSMWCSVFDLFGYPQKPFYSFEAYHAMLLGGGFDSVRRLPARAGENGLYVCATGNGAGDLALLAAPYHIRGDRHSIRFDGADPGARYVLEKRLIDEAHAFDVIDTQYGSLSELRLDTWLPGTGVLLLTLKRK